MNLDRGHLLTEQANGASENLDQLSSLELAALFASEDKLPQQAVEAAVPQLAQAIDAISLRLKQGGRLFYLGAGTSGRLGVLDAAECPPTFCSDPSLVQGVLAGGAAALLRSSEGLEDLFEGGKADLQTAGFNSSDALVGIAAGGTTPYVLGVLLMPKRLVPLPLPWPVYQQSKHPCLARSTFACSLAPNYSRGLQGLRLEPPPRWP